MVNQDRIERITSNIVDIEEGYIVHGCNAQGVMNSGVAKAIRDKYPQVWNDYNKVFRGMIDRNNLVGSVIYTEIKPDKLYIASGITQLNYGKDGKRYVSYDAIAHVFGQVSMWAQRSNKTIYFPQIGAGLGGGYWPAIENIIISVVPADVKLALVTLPTNAE